MTNNPLKNWTGESSAIPRSIYIDLEVYAREQERIFRGPTWHFVAHVSELTKSGDYKRSTIADVPIFIVRGSDGEIRGFVNACAHRGAEVVIQKRGNAKGSIRCIYHGWTFDLKGRLGAVGLPGGFPENFCKEDHGLPPVRVEIFHGCIFATLDPKSQPLHQYLGATVRGLLATALGDEELVYLGSQAVQIRCNWKCYVENIFDSYHAQVLHGLVRVMRTRESPESAAEVGYSEDGRFPHAWTRYRGKPIETNRRDLFHDYSLFDVRARNVPDSHVICFFPGDMITCQLDILQLRYIRPKGVDTTEIEFANFARRSDSPELVEHRLHQSNLTGPAGYITLEDACALERVHNTAKSGGSNIVVKGLIPDRPRLYAEEAAMCDFYDAYRTIMSE